MIASVSVVMPHYNALSTVGRSIESVMAQSMPVHELIIVDDASSDFAALEKLVQRYSSHLNIILLQLAVNGGAPNARNVGIARASSTYIAFLDSDDTWHPQKIAVQYAYMQAHRLNLTGHGYIFDLQQKPFQAVAELASKVISRRSFRWGNPLFTPTVMARKGCFIRFDERFRRVDDYKCWYENLCNGNHQLLNLELAGGYKQAIGASGLSGSVRLMHQSYIEVLRSLRTEGKMSFVEFLLTVACETFKYPIRSLLIQIRKG